MIKKKIFFAITFACLTACGGGSSSGGSSSGGSSSDVDSKPDSEVTIPNAYTYFLSGTDLMSFNFANGETSKISSSSETFNFGFSVSKAIFDSSRYLFNLENGSWTVVNRVNNVPRKISSALIQNQVCETFVLSDTIYSNIFYSTAGDDNSCRDKEDNQFYRIDSTMDATDSSVQLSKDFNYDVNSTLPIVINNRLSGMLVKDKNDNLLFSNLDATDTVQIAEDVTGNGELEIYNFESSKKTLIRVKNNLYYVTPEQLKDGVLGEPIFTNTRNSLKVFDQDEILFYKGGADGKVYHFDSSTGLSTVVFDAEVSMPGKFVSSVEPGLNSILVEMVSGETISVNIEDISNPTTKILTLSTRELRSTTSTEGGFVGSDFTDDGKYVSYFISDLGAINRIDDAEWVLVSNGSSKYRTLPVLFRYGEEKNSLTLWSTSTKKDVRKLGDFDKNIIDFRVDQYSKNGLKVMHSRSGEPSSNGNLLSFNVNEDDSLKIVDSKSINFVF